MRLAQRLRFGGSDLLIELVGQNVLDEGFTEFHELNQHERRFLARAVLAF